MTPQEPPGRFAEHVMGDSAWAQLQDASQPPIVIAEVSANHLGSLTRAIELIGAAKEAGADVVKLQHYSPETITVNSQLPEFTITGESLWSGRSLWELYDEAMMPWEWTEKLVAECHKLNLEWFSSPFDETAVDFLEEFSPSMYKIASFEVIDLPLIEKVALQGKPLIISTGMATEEEISDAVETTRNAGNHQLALLRTNSAYPAAIDEMDLAAIPYMARTWGLPVGLSDHTLDHTSAIVSVGLGARVFEKHLTLSRSDGGPDSAFSLEPQEFADYVQKIKDAHSSLGKPRFGPSEKEHGSLGFRPSVRATRDIKAGEKLSPENIATVRPAGGLEPKFWSETVGKVVRTDVVQGQAITSDIIEPQ